MKRAIADMTREDTFIWGVAVGLAIAAVFRWVLA